MLAEIAPEQLAAALDAIAEQLLAEARVEGPPVDAFRLAAALGVEVAWHDGQPHRAQFVRIGGHRGGRGKPTILVRPDPRSERRHWAVAHEIGEHAAWRVFHGLAIDPREAMPLAREQVANQLANRLLLPTGWFGRDGSACDWDLPALKTRYATASHELIARRMLDFPPPVIVTIVDQGKAGFRRGNIPGRVPPLSACEMQCWRTAHESGRPCRNEGGMRTIRAWPIHETQWKREILRTDMEEAFS